MKKKKGKFTQWYFLEIMNDSFSTVLDLSSVTIVFKFILEEIQNT